MTKPQRIYLISFLALALIASIVLAGALSQLTFQSGEPFGLGSLLWEGLASLRAPDVDVAASSTSQSQASKWIARFVFWVGLPFAIIYSIVSPEARKRLLRMMPTFIALLLLLFWLERLPKEQPPQEVEQAAAGDLAQAAPLAPPPAPDYISDPPGWLLLTADALLLLLFLAGAWYVWRRFQERQAKTPQALIVEEAERTIYNIQTGQDLRHAIIQCYAAMNRVLEEDKKIARRRGMTPREFEAHLASFGVDDAHIQRLTRLFEQVRYGSKATGGREEREALDCLNAIVTAYGKPA